VSGGGSCKQFPLVTGDEPVVEWLGCSISEGDGSPPALRRAPSSCYLE